MKKILIILTTAATLGFGIAGYAQSVNNSSSQAGPYVGAGLGIGGMDTPALTSNEKAGTTSSSENIREGAAGRIYGGYLWQVSNFLVGGEAGYTKYQDNKYKVNFGPASIDWTYTGSTIDLLGVAKYVFNSGFNAFGKAGIAITQQKVDISATGLGSQSKSKSAVLPEVAFGVGYDWTQQFSTNITYAHSFGNEPSTPDTATDLDDMDTVASVDTLLVNAEYHFG